MFIKKNPKGLVLTEVLLSVAMMGIAVLVLGSIINGAVKITSWSRSQLIAESLVTEAIEGIKNLRDTNWLQEPLNDDCWIRVDPQEACTVVVKENMSYTVQQNSVGQWSLSNENSEALDLEADSKGEYVLYVDNVGGLQGYVHTSGVESRFYRGVTFTKVTLGEVSFRVSVQWYEGAKVHKVDREITLNNFR